VIIPLQRIYPESRQGRWLRIYVQDEGFVPPATPQSQEAAAQAPPQATSKYAKYMTSEQATASKAEAVPTTLPKGVKLFYLERRGKFLAHRLLEDIVKGVYKF